MWLSAIDRGDLERVRELVAHGAEATLHDAARILGLIRGQRPDQFEKAAVRWMARYAAERERDVDDLAQAVDALDLLREDPGAAATLAQLAR
jgi:hypothetical protein